MKRLVVVVIIALVGAAAAFVAFRDDARRGCLAEGSRDPSYSAEFEEPPRMDVKTHVLTVSHEGMPVTGARVCMNVDMVGMSAMGVGDEAREISPGRYELSMNFAMAGPWEGVVLIEEEGGQTIEVPVAFDVTSGGMR